METFAQRCARILAALEDLVAQEAAALKTGDFAAVNELQDRIAPLVDFLVQQREWFADDFQLRHRLEAVQVRRQESITWLAAEIARTRDELQQMHAAKRRVAQIAPAYGRAAPVPAQRQFAAVG